MTLLNMWDAVFNQDGRPMERRAAETQRHLVVREPMSVDLPRRIRDWRMDRQGERT
jgi:hypothetical protein